MKPALIAFAALAPACLAVPDGPEPMCATTADCDQDNGEVCDEGVCWGNPPKGPFVAVVSPPSQRSADLVSVELHDLKISSDGWVDDVYLEPPVIYMARLACAAPISCNASELTATITISRKSSIIGGPGFTKAVDVDGADPFQIGVPRTHDGQFEVLVLPTGRDVPGSNQTPAQIVPPLRTMLEIKSSTSGQLIELGGNGPSISGSVRNELGQAAKDYRVVAVGRWDLLDSPREVSTVDFTGTTGTFSIQLAEGLVGDVDIVAKPFGTTGGLRPTLRLGGLRGIDPASNVTLQWPQGMGTEFSLDVDVDGFAGNGERVDVQGARVILTAKTEGVGGAIASITAEAETDASGVAKLKLLNGAAFQQRYRLSIVPPPSASMGVVFDELALFPLKRTLPERVALSGRVYDFDGNPAQDISVTAQPSLKFVWTLDPAIQSFLTAIAPPTATTPASGEFLLWVDPLVATIWGYYDIVLEPPAMARVPAYVFSNYEIPRIPMSTHKLPDITLPDAAFVRVNIHDDLGDTLPGAELKVYAVEDQALCDLKNAPQSCEVPARLMGRGAADKTGRARLTLPRK